MRNRNQFPSSVTIIGNEEDFLITIIPIEEDSCSPVIFSFLVITVMVPGVMKLYSVQIDESIDLYYCEAETWAT